MTLEEIREMADDEVRRIVNKRYAEGGLEAVERHRKSIRTCDNCGHETDAEFLEDCPICNRGTINRLDDLDRRLSELIKQNERPQ